MESDEDYELLNEGTAMSELDFSDNQGGDTSSVVTRARACIRGETSKKIKK